MLETLIFQCSIAIAHKFDNFTNISKRLWDLVYVWSVLLSLKFQANTYSFERVVTLFVGYYFSSGHRVDEHLTWKSHINLVKNKAAKMIGSIKRLKFTLPLSALRISYNAFVLPCLNYGVILWGEATKLHSSLSTYFRRKLSD